jgi:hypothetical protein
VHRSTRRAGKAVSDLGFFFTGIFTPISAAAVHSAPLCRTESVYGLGRLTERRGVTFIVWRGGLSTQEIGGFDHTTEDTGRRILQVVQPRNGVSVLWAPVRARVFLLG